MNLSDKFVYAMLVIGILGWLGILLEVKFDRPRWTLSDFKGVCRRCGQLREWGHRCADIPVRARRPTGVDTGSRSA